MVLPFSNDAFLDVFGAYNTLLWPAVLLIWAATAIVVWAWLRGKGVSRRILWLLLAVHWSWAGIAYHWFFFRGINPAATIFAALFTLQALLFVWLATRANARLVAPAGVRGVVGGALMVYGLIYPFFGLAGELEYPRLPLFAVPCPTTLVTIGMLVATPGVPRTAGAIPFLWAVVGSSAAFTIGIKADMALVAAAVFMALDLVAPSVLGGRRVA